jgi:hypothetical protein
MRKFANLSAFILLVIGTAGLLVNEFFWTGVKPPL